MTVIIGIDPHKRSHTAVALDEHDQVLDQLRIDADATQLRRLLKFARRWPERTWAIENANGLGRLLARQLVDADPVEAGLDLPEPSLETFMADGGGWSVGAELTDEDWNRHVVGDDAGGEPTVGTRCGEPPYGGGVPS